jgi:hypothetical protein
MAYDGDDPEMEAFMAKTFENGEPVMIRRLGPSHEGKEYRATIRGTYGCKPFESYIVEWYNPDEFENNKWACCVMSKGCIDKIEG